MAFNNLYKKIAALETLDIEREIISIIRENEDTILSLVRGQMGSKGTRGDGKFTKAKYGNTYRDFTVFNKEIQGIGLGKKTDFVTMFMTGEFYSSLKLVTAGTTFSITSDVPYSSILNYGWNEGKLLELDKQNLKYFRDSYILPQLKARIEARMKQV
jgi:hypothetical protein